MRFILIAWVLFSTYAWAPGAATPAPLQINWWWPDGTLIIYECWRASPEEAGAEPGVGIFLHRPEGSAFYSCGEVSQHHYLPYLPRHRASMAVRKN